MQTECVDTRADSCSDQHVTRVPVSEPGVTSVPALVTSGSPQHVTNVSASGTSDPPTASAVCHVTSIPASPTHGGVF